MLYDHDPQRSAFPSTSAHRFGRAPGDLLIEIALFLEARSDLLNLCLTSSYVFSHVASVLYETVVLESAEQCDLTLGMLMERTDIARHVRNLIIRPQARYKNSFSPLESAAASASVRKIAGALCLDALVKFQWAADELPYHEDMWFALRLGCPQLRYVGTSVGSYLPSLNSHLFDFCDLLGFSLTLEHGFYECHIDMFLDGLYPHTFAFEFETNAKRLEDQPIFKKLWDMLIYRCPNLEELAIDGHSSVPTDIHNLVEARWPNLRKLSLGDVCIDWFPRSLEPGEKRPFITFLEAHPKLESLHLSRHTIQPIHFTTLEPSILANVTSFSGTHQQLQALPHLHRTVTSVSFSDPVETREVSAPTVASLLRDLTSLTELKISFTLHSMYDSGNLLRSLIQSCPMLRHLELTCGRKPSFQLDTFAKTIRGFPKLRTLHLTIVKYPGDETLARGATRIARSNPRLKHFSLSFIPPVYPVPLPYAIPYRPAFLWCLFPSRCTGSFEITTDTHGLPLSLSCREQTLFSWPWGLGVSTRTGRYTRDLRPVGYIGSRKTGVRAFVALVFEKSAAGEEMRMILFCAFLAFLACVGIGANGANRKMAAARLQMAAVTEGVPVGVEVEMESALSTPPVAVIGT